MKTLLKLTFIFLPALSLYGQNIEYRTHDSTLFVYSEKLAKQPFALGKDKLKQIIADVNPEVEVYTRINRHTDAIDTSLILTTLHDTLNVFHNSNETYLQSAYIHSSKFRTKHHLIVGMTKKEFLYELPELKISTFPDKVVFSDFEEFDYLCFLFKNGVLTAIRFEANFD